MDEAAAAIGIEKQEMKREYVARRRVEVNSLAAVAIITRDAVGGRWVLTLKAQVL